MSELFNVNGADGVDVIIAGAGPVGLLLACELRLGGASVLVLEREPDPAHPLKSLPFGTRGLSAPTIAALYRRGLLDAIVAPHESVTAGAHWKRPGRALAGHFAGIEFFRDRIDACRWPYWIAGPAPMHLATSMQHLEAVLTERAQSLGVTIRRRVAITGCQQSADDVVVHAAHEKLRARWLVGCDGGRSTVRKVAGFEVAGTEPAFTGYSVLATLDDASSLAAGRNYTANGVYTFQAPGTIALVDFDGGACHRMASISRAHVQAVLQKISGTCVRVRDLHLASTWTDRAFQATTYRMGRVLLAGDAAHIHSPLGGQGLNLGLGDAMNLGWKLAATIRGDAPDVLLDSYTAERHPVGSQVLDWSRAQVALMRPEPGARALAAIVRDLADTREGASYFAGRLWGVTTRYAPGDDGGEAHPLVGMPVPDFDMDDGSRCADLFRTGQGVLLDFDPRRPLQALANGWARRVHYAAMTARDTLGITAVLVRPDGIVAWAGGGVPDERRAFDAARRWFGDPS